MKTRETDNLHDSSLPVQDSLLPVQDSSLPVQDSSLPEQTHKIRRQIGTQRAFDCYEVASVVQRIKMSRKDGDEQD